MSGTSADAIDACAVDFSKKRPLILAKHTTQIHNDLQRRIIDLSQGEKVSARHFGELNQELSKKFSQCAEKLISKRELRSKKIEAIGLAGQTVWHAPKDKNPFTMQLGDPNLIASNNGVKVVSNFRNSHIALGGEGAPLTTYFHAELFGARKKRLILNLGGIANITLLDRGTILGTDIGPANALIDIYCQKKLGIKFDKNGKLASKGKVDNASLKSMLKHNFFRKRYPKTTGKELFNYDFIPKRLLAKNSSDCVATLNEFSALIISKEINKLVDGPIEIYACGGGIYNTTLLNNLEGFLDHKIQSTNILGVDPDYLEAMTFAWLARNAIRRIKTKVFTSKGLVYGYLGSITEIR